MKKVKCPNCGRWFFREDRELLAERFCRMCIHDRIKASVSKKIPIDAIFKQTCPGYFVYK
jgi:hypothetical protein